MCLSALLLLSPPHLVLFGLGELWQWRGLLRCQAGEHWSACGRSLIYSGCRSPSLSPPLHTHTQSHMRSSVGLSLTHSLFPSCHFNISSSPSYSLPSLSFSLSFSQYLCLPLLLPVHSAVTDSINQLITMCTQQAPGQKECDNALRELEVQSPSSFSFLLSFFPPLLFLFAQYLLCEQFWLLRDDSPSVACVKDTELVVAKALCVCVQWMFFIVLAWRWGGIHCWCYWCYSLQLDSEDAFTVIHKNRKWWFKCTIL